MKRLPVNDPEFLPKGESAFLTGLASLLPDPARVLELGTGKGTSFTAIAYGLALHAEWHIWTVNVGECVEGRESIERAHIPPKFYTATRATTEQYEREFSTSVHLLYVDADHTYSGARSDIEAFGGRVVQGGLIALDDYCELHHGVMRAIDELMTLPWWKFVGRVGRLIAFERQE